MYVQGAAGQPGGVSPGSIDLIEACVRAGRPVPPIMLEQLHRLADPSDPALAAVVWRARVLLD